MCIRDSSVADVARAMEDYPQAMVLGVRRFRENKDMPKANLMGNQITRFVFFLPVSYTHLSWISAAWQPLAINITTWKC